MKKILVSAALVVSLASVPAFAKGKPAGRGNEKHEEKSEKWKDKEKEKEKDKDKDKDDKYKGHKEKDRDRSKDKDHGRTANNSRPAGWDKGKKTGWGNCDVPPGQAKKQGCRGTTTRRPVVVARKERPRTYPTRTYPTRTYPTRRRTVTPTTTTTSTTATAPTEKKGTHPFEPVLRQKQEGGRDQRTIKQSVK